MVFTRGLRAVANIIRQRVWLFLAVVALQLVFLVVISAVSVSYQTEVLESSNSIIEPIAAGEFDDKVLEEGGAFLNDPLEVYRAFEALKQNLLEWLGAIIGLSILFQVILWSCSLYLAKRVFSWKRVLGQFIVSVVFWLVIVGVGYLSLKGAFTSFDDVQLLVNGLGQRMSIVYLVALYFASVLWALPERVFSWKGVRGLFSIGIVKFGKMSQLTLFCLVLLFLAVGSVYLSLEYDSFLTLLVPLFVALCLSVARLVWIMGVREIGRAH